MRFPGYAEMLRFGSASSSSSSSSSSTPTTNKSGGAAGDTSAAVCDAEVPAPSVWVR